MAYVPNSGSVIAFQNPGSIQATSVAGGNINVNNFPTNQNIAGSVAAFQNGTWNVSITGTINTGNSSVQVLNFPVSQNVSGSVVQFQGGTQITSLVSTIPSSVIVGASIFGLAPVSVSNFPTTQNVSGSVAAFIQANPSVVAYQAPGSILAVSATVNTGNSSVQVLNFPTTQNVSGSVAAFQNGTWNVSITGTINAGNSSVQVLNFPATQAVTQSGTWITSLVSTVPSSVIVGASIFGTVPVTGFPTNQSVSGTVGASTIGTVPTTQAGTWISSLVSTVPSSVIVGASIFGLPPVNVTNTNLNVSGSVAAFVQGTPNVNTAGSVISFQGGTWATSMVGAPIFAENSANTSSDKGIFILGLRNDTVASVVASDKNYGPLMTDSQGRLVNKPFIPNDATLIEYASSIVSTSVTLIQSSAVGKRSYITDFYVANTGSVATLVTIKDGSTSILGNTIAPGGGGSNLPGLNLPIRTANAQDLTFVAGTAVSVLYVNVRGYQAQ